MIDEWRPTIFFEKPGQTLTPESCGCCSTSVSAAPASIQDVTKISKFEVKRSICLSVFQPPSNTWLEGHCRNPLM